jgi:polysaccharide pyruvyl transferase WcaK-like protein
VTRIHLGHHFYGAGNLGDDFMLAGFLGATRQLAPEATFTSCVPFPLEPLRRRFPDVAWLPYDDATRARCITDCDAWLGLGGSPFQSAQSRWFVDHLIADAAHCAQAGKPMFFLGVGVQTTVELAAPDIRRVCDQAVRIWTRDTASAERLAALGAAERIAAAADCAHLWFRDVRPPAAATGRLTLVANFDYGTWPGQAECLSALEKFTASERVWLAQESRELPGAERALFATLPSEQRSRWRFVSPEEPGMPLPTVFARWPSGEWLVTARYHAALAGAWAGSKIVVLDTNEKLRAAAREFSAPLLSPDARESDIMKALAAATTVNHEVRSQAEHAFRACAEFVQAVNQRSGIAPPR